MKMKNPFKSMPIDEKFIREHLALERTKLANERTLLSYTQAALYFLLGGLALFQLKEYEQMGYIGYLALVFSGLFFIIGIWRYFALKRKMKNLLRPYKNPVTEEKKEENPL
jgi:putative membrane protein